MAVHVSKFVSAGWVEILLCPLDVDDDVPKGKQMLYKKTKTNYQNCIQDVSALWSNLVLIQGCYMRREVGVLF